MTTQSINQPTHKAEGPTIEITKSQQKFINFLHSQSIMNTRLKGKKHLDGLGWVHISMYDIERKFFIFKQGQPAKQNINFLIKNGIIERKKEFRTDKFPFLLYRLTGLRPGSFRPDLIVKTRFQFDQPFSHMLDVLKTVSFQNEIVKTTPYFQAFLQHKEKYFATFFVIDNFSGRVHTPVTSLSGEARKSLLINGKEVKSIDIATMQPLILGNILFKSIGKNTFSDWIDSGKDIYQILAIEIHSTRDQAKERFFQISYGMPSNELAEIFGNEKWVRWINWIKKQDLPGNPHTHEKPHSNLAWLLQKKEVKIMLKIWENFATENIPFLTVHDEIIVPAENLEKTLNIMRNILNQNFKYFNLKY